MGKILRLASLSLIMLLALTSCQRAETVYGYETEIKCQKKDGYQYNTYIVKRSDGREWQTTHVIAYTGRIEGIDMLVPVDGIKNFKRIATSDGQTEEAEHINEAWTTVSRTVINRYRGTLLTRAGSVDIPRCVMRTIETDVIFTDEKTGKVIIFENSIKTEITANGIEKQAKFNDVKLLYETIGEYVGTYYVEIKSTLNGEPFSKSRAEYDMYLPLR